MQYEVEQKFPVSDMPALEQALGALGASISAANEEIDLYYAHPSRDFAKTDEALRIRRKGGKHCITYKGPKIDTTTKTRQEIELPLGEAENTTEAWNDLLTALCFTPIAEVRKLRRKALVEWEGRTIEASLDQIEGLGTFAELELVVAPSGLEAAKTAIASLAARLGLHESERRSYLQLLLNLRGSGCA